jgi:D-aspartate ligase
VTEDAPLACVLGEIDLVHALGLAGIRSAVAAVPGDPALFSRHTTERIPWFHPSNEPQRMLGSLLDWGRRQEMRPVLFFNGDHDLLLVSRGRQELRRYFDFSIAEADLVEDLVDKQRFAELALRLDLPVPPSLTLDPATSSPDEVEIPYPLIVKPLMHRHEIWNPISGGAKALRVESRDQLNRWWPRLLDQGPIIAQTLIPGPESRIVSYHVFRNEDGETACEFSGRKIRTIPSEYGETTALEVTRDEEVLALGRELSDRLRLTGVAKFDLKRDEGGRLWLLEVNPRFNLWHHAGARAGANIPACVYAGLTGRPATTCSFRSGVTWCHPTQDLRQARAAGMGWVGWARWALACDAKWAVSLRDPWPFLRGVIARRIKNRFGAR